MPRIPSTSFVSPLRFPPGLVQALPLAASWISWHHLPVPSVGGLPPHSPTFPTPLYPLPPPWAGRGLGSLTCACARRDAAPQRVLSEHLGGGEGILLHRVPFFSYPSHCPLCTPHSGPASVLRYLVKPRHLCAVLLHPYQHLTCPPTLPAYPPSLLPSLLLPPLLCLRHLSPCHDFSDHPESLSPTGLTVPLRLWF